jgi:TPR repeat protein
MRIHHFSTIIVSTMLIVSAAYAQNCTDGEAAKNAGDYAKAKGIFEPLAVKGNACAEYQLGEMYMQGKGVPEDKVKALQYFKQAAAQGDPKSKVMVSFLNKRK